MAKIEKKPAPKKKVTTSKKVAKSKKVAPTKSKKSSARKSTLKSSIPAPVITEAPLAEPSTTIEREPLEITNLQHASPHMSASRPTFSLPHISISRRVVKAVLVGIGIAVVVAALFLLLPTKPTVVPKDIRKNIPFSIYYPDQSKLPKGYTLQKASFTSPDSGVVLYAVTFPRGKFVLSVQEKPDKEELDSFTNQRLPVRYTLSTPNGRATVGVLGNQLVASLPTNSDSWVIVTSPQNTRQAEMRSLLNSLVR